MISDYIGLLYRGGISDGISDGISAVPRTISDWYIGRISDWYVGLYRTGISDYIGLVHQTISDYIGSDIGRPGIGNQNDLADV